MNHAENPENPLRYTKTATLFVFIGQTSRYRICLVDLNCLGSRDRKLNFPSSPPKR